MYFSRYGYIYSAVGFCWRGSRYLFTLDEVFDLELDAEMGKKRGKKLQNGMSRRVKALFERPSDGEKACRVEMTLHGIDILFVRVE